MPHNFDPKPGDSIYLFEQGYVVQPHPQMPSMAYRQKAGRARVYQLRNQQEGQYFALKEFRKLYRTPNLLDSYRNLHRVEDFEGLRAAERRIVLPEDPAAQRYPNLQYAMLMSWIDDTTWFDVLAQARGGDYPDLATAIGLCDRFLEVMEGLEANEMAHTDISPGNVMVGFDPIEVQLLDLEEMYMPGADAPLQPHSGSNGYSHRSSQTTWKPEGDRYAAAVLAAEMLILAKPELARRATDEGFFAGHCQTSEGMARFQEARPWLEQVAPEFAEVFEGSWSADSLAECPSICELRAPIKELATRTFAPVLLPDTDVVKWERSGAKAERDSSGSIPVEVPDLIGQSLPETRSTLAAAGLKLGARTKAPSEEVPEGRVVNQYPWAGTRAKRGSSVVVMLSSGAEELTTTEERVQAHRSQPERAGVTVVVPDLLGQNRPEAKRMLTAAGLKLGGQIKAPNENVPEDRIAKQYPKAGTKAKRGSSVSVTFSSGPQKEKAATTQERVPTHQSQPRRAGEPLRPAYLATVLTAITLAIVVAVATIAAHLTLGLPRFRGLFLFKPQPLLSF